MRSLSIRSVIAGPPREPRSLPGELSRVLLSPECLRRLRSLAAGTASTETLDAEQLGCNFCSVETVTSTSTVVSSFTGNKFCTTITHSASLKAGNVSFLCARKSHHIKASAYGSRVGWTPARRIYKPSLEVVTITLATFPPVTTNFDL